MDNEYDDAQTGGDEESLSVDQAASAFLKSTSEEAEGQSDDDLNDEGENADELLESEEGEEPTDEDESEDDGDPDDEEGQSEDEDDDEQPETEGGRFVANDGRVRLPDGTTVTVGELVQGNLRDRDYRQKTMGLADERRQFEEQSSSLKASQQEVEQQRDYMVNLLQSIIPQAPDPSMVADDPIGYTQAKAQHDQWMQHLNYLQQQQQQTSHQTEQQTQQERQKKAGEEWVALQEAMPELKDQKKVQSFVAEINRVGQEYGFSNEELSQQLPYDHRMILALRDANKWRKLQASKPKAKEKVKGRPPVQKGGKRLTPNARNAKHAQDAVNRLKQSGSVEDATAAWLANLNKG